MKRRRRSGCMSIVLGLVLSLFCILILGVGIAYVGLPDTLLNIGPVSTELEPIERVSLTGYIFLHLNEINSPLGEPSQMVDLLVEQGDSAATVVSKLESTNIIQDGTLLRNYLRFRGLDTKIEAGGYSLNGGMTLREVAEALQNAKASEWSFTVVEGWRREQIALALSDSNLMIDAQVFLEFTTPGLSGSPSWVDIPNGMSLEGFLFPDTYLLDRETTAESFVLTMIENLESRITHDMLAGFSAQGLNLYQAITLASIVEREAVVPDERELIASVFVNRLAIGMRLEADPTVQYALGKQADGSWWKAPLSLTDLNFNSPYNTYLIEGLPIGPICNPGLESIKAVAFPATTDYLFFRAMCDGSGRHSFAQTFEEHQLNACQ